jgi:hypothetical protein
MKKSMLMIFVALLAGSQVSGQAEVALRKELDILKPLVGKTWICESKDPSGRQTLHLLRLYEPMHDGKILKIYQECRELNSRMDGYYFYDPDKKEIAYLTLTNNGNIAVGNVKEEDGRILLSGYAIFPDRKLESRNTFEITSKGEMIDKYFRLENGQWLAGHSRVWTAK